MDNKTRDENFNMSSTCRTCACNYDNDDLIPIFLNNYNQIKPKDFIESFYTNNFKLSENDYLPKNICNNCFKNFTILKAFIDECEKAEKILKNYFLKVDNNFKYKDINIYPKLISKHNAIKNCSVRLKKIKIKELIPKIKENHTKYNSLFSKSLNENVNNTPESIIKTETTNNLEIIEEQMLTNVSSPDLWNKSDDDFKYSSSEDEIKLKVLDTKNIDNNKLNRIKCTICPVIFCEMNYTRHMKKHRPSILSECTICNKLVDDIEIHKLKTHKIKFDCKDCEETFDSRPKYTIHRFRKHEKPEHVCKICEKSYIFLYHLKKHEQTCHSNVANAICDICGKTFKNPNVLASHRATHILERKININDINSKQMSSEINTFKCPYCSLKFRNLFGLKNHSKHHKKLKHSETYKHVCEFCSQRFNRSDHLQLHLDLVHLKNLPFECQYCSKKFVKQYVLNQHVRRRHQETSHICQYCNKEYAFRVSLTRHIRSHHLMLKRFKCDICGEAFITGIQCQKHMQNHTIQEEQETVKRIYGEILDAGDD